VSEPIPINFIDYLSSNRLNLSVFISNIDVNGKKKDAYKKNGCTPECASNNGLEATRGGDPPRG
jgi:hypothetical protein